MVNAQLKKKTIQDHVIRNSNHHVSLPKIDLKYHIGNIKYQGPGTICKILENMYHVLFYTYTVHRYNYMFYTY